MAFLSGKPTVMTGKRGLWLLPLALLAYLLFWPVAIEPVAWTPPPPLDYEALAQRVLPMKPIERLAAGECHACEDVAVDSAARVYGADERGIIKRYDPAAGRTEDFAITGGRPLGLHFDAGGNLLVADAIEGLLSVSPDGRVRLLSTGTPERRVFVADDLDIAPDGAVYFSDASRRFPLTQYKLDLLEHRPNGSFWVYRPDEGRTELLLDSLHFANGVAVSAEGDFVLVNETGAYRVLRYWLKGPQRGRAEVFLDRLPGFPDGISRGENGLFWLTLISPRKPALDALMAHPFLRKILARLPAFLQPAPEPWAYVLGVDASGRVRYLFQDPEGAYQQISSVQQFGNKLYLGSLAEESVGVFTLPE